MTLPGDEPLTNLFLPESAGPAQNVKYRQGVILTFNQITLQNTVLVGDTVLTDLPILGVGEATLLRPESVVGIIVIGEDTRAKSYAIIGRLVTPNTAEATSAVSLFNSQIYSDQISSLPSGESTSSTTYVDLATLGPQVTVPVGPTGRILIIATAQMQWGTLVTAHQSGGGVFNVAFSGANTRTPNDNVDQLVGIYTNDITVSAGTVGFANIISVTTQAIFSGLNPGDTAIKMMYRKAGAATVDPNFFRRTLTVIKL
jgi:hypothetical protein